jgi:SAM-dependent methyltransferase
LPAVPKSRESPPAPDEALLVSAHVAHTLAREHCLHAVGGDCTWYHGVWQYLRALGFVKNAGGHRVFLRDTLASLALTGNMRRVLISGAADDAMTLIAIEASRSARIPLEVTVLDRCETPLALSRWSAAKAGFSVSTKRADILEFGPGSSYDVITTTSFLGYFDPAARRRLFARWASLLRPGGKLVFTNRLRPNTAAGTRSGFAPHDAEALATAVRSQAERYRNPLGLEPAALESWAREYAARMTSFPLRSVDEVVALLDHAGFVGDQIDTAVPPGTSSGAAIAGPTSAGRAEYVRVLATRG